jgi:hypothetical protein
MPRQHESKPFDSAKFRNCQIDDHRRELLRDLPRHRVGVRRPLLKQ